MSHIHPSEKEIQQYALAHSDSNPEAIAHIQSCPDCQAEVSTYQMLFSEIKQQSGARFDFDLSELVLSQLPETNSRLSADNIIIGFLVIFTLSCISIPVYIFRKAILNMFIDIPPFFIYSIILSTTGILIIKILSLYKKYLRQMHYLNFNSFRKPFVTITVK